MDIAGIEQQCTLTKYVDTSKEQTKIESDSKIVATDGTAEAGDEPSAKHLEHMEISEENQPGIIEQSLPDEVRTIL